MSVKVTEMRRRPSSGFLDHVHSSEDGGVGFRILFMGGASDNSSMRGGLLIPVTLSLGLLLATAAAAGGLAAKNAGIETTLAASFPFAEIFGVPISRDRTSGV